MSRTNPSSYTATQNIRLHRDLHKIVADLAAQNERTLPKQIVAMMEQELAKAQDRYELNAYTDVFVMDRNPRENIASNQIKLYLRPETKAQINQLAAQAGVNARDVRTSLLLDALQCEGRLK